MFRSLFAALVALLTLPAAHAACPTRQEAVLPLTVWQDKLLLPITINGSTQMIALDTGAGISAISTAVADSIDLPHDFDHAAHLDGVGGRESTLNIGQIDSLDLGQVHLTHLSLPIIDLPLKTANGQPVAGLLGSDILRRFDVEIDIPAGRLTLWRQATCSDPQPPWTETSDPVPFTLDDGYHILVPFRLDGAHLTGVLDTGAAGFAVTLGAAYHAGVTDDALERDIPIHGTGVNNQEWNGYLHKFGAVGLGGTSFHDQQAALVPSSYASRNDALIGSDALLGYSLLKTLRLWISYPSKTLFLQ